MAETIIKLIVGGAALVFFILVIVLPMSFSNLEYYEMGFRRQKSTGTVKVDEVYNSGKHFIGPDFEFKVFQADAHFVSLNRVRAFASDKLEVQLSVNFQYFLREDQLPDLHRAYDLYYEEIMKASANDALKGAIPVFETRQLFQDRRLVEQEMYKAVKSRLGGKCCDKVCTSDPLSCPANCEPYATCKNKGLFVDVKYFQMAEVYIPEDVKERYLRTLTLKEDALKESFLQDAQVERKKTQSEVQQAKNAAREIMQQAQAESGLIQVSSQANYTATVERARSIGLRSLYTRLNITEQGHKSSFDYLRTLRGMNGINLSVDFQQNIMGSFK